MNYKDFNPDKYKKTSWKVVYTKLDNDYLPRLIVNCATGRKYWPIFSVLTDTCMGINDKALSQIKHSLYSYTHPMIDRFVDELNIMLSDIYNIEIDLRKVKNIDMKSGNFSSVKF